MLFSAPSMFGLTFVVQRLASEEQLITRVTGGCACGEGSELKVTFLGQVK